jgi:tripartite-type tricarboxylate transporter receptor subunit TctC
MDRDQSESPARAPRRAHLGVAIAAAVLIAAACTGPGASPGGGGTGDWDPGGPITIVVPFTAGGPTDTVTRQIAGPMGEALGEQIVVSNVAGAGGTLAAGQVAAAAPDGLTVLMHHIGMSTAPTLYPDLEYDPLTSFKTIGLVTEVPMTIIGAARFEPNTLEELVAYVKANGTDVNYANAGVGAASHLCGVMLENAIGADVTEVEYEGTADAIDDLLNPQSQDVDFLCDQTTNTTTHIKAGTVKAYAITSPEQNDALPDVPTTAEAGLPDVLIQVWHGLYVPSGTPDNVVQALTAALKEALVDETVTAEFAKLGTAPVSADQATPQAHTAKLKEQIELWRPLLEGSAASTAAPS